MRRRLLVLLVASSVWLVAPVASASPPWRAPVRGPVVGAFSFDATAPYAAGRRRGLDFAAARGEVVRAACPGTVTWAGRVPLGGRGVTVRCGALVATHLGLAAVGLARGRHVRAGSALGTAAGPRLRLRARGARGRPRPVGPPPPLARP